MNPSGSNSDLIEVAIRPSLWKSVLLAGADRRVTIIVLGSCMVLVLLSRFSLWPCIAAVVLATLGQWIGVRLASVDTHLIDVYLRHISYRRLYSARSDIAYFPKTVHPSIPKV